MRTLEAALEGRFNKWYCTSCKLYWWLGINFKPSYCPFCYVSQTVIPFPSEEVRRELENPGPPPAMPEEVTLEEYENIFKGL